MYDIRQFKPTLYILLMLGITGFALASESPGIWVLAGGGLLLNAWLVKTGRFTPMPRLLANLLTVLAMGFVAMEIRDGDSAPIIIIGQFLVMLHLVKVFEQRANRDYAQLLVLSLLLMVSAAISSASLIFGLTFIVYMFISLYCCLLFHLKVEADQAKAAYGLPQDKISPITLQQDQRYLARSMRRLTALVSFVAIVLAVAVFLFFPRGGAEFLGPGQFRSSQTLIGFSDQVSFQKIAQISESSEVVARVELFQGDQPITNPGSLLLRGSALDVYSGNDDSRGGQWTWSRSRHWSYGSSRHNLSPDEVVILDPSHPEGEFRQKITLQPTGTRALFAMAGVVSISSPGPLNVFYSDADGVMESMEVLRRPIEYTVVSTGNLPIIDDPDGGAGSAWRNSVIDPQIRDFARRPEVCGRDAAGRLLADRPLTGDHSYDGQIALNFEHYLKTNFTYTLDLTSAGSIGRRDPIVAFLTDFKRGHCEYFAGAMTLMCQSLGIPARVAVGFSCQADDFNSLGNYFLVKQSDAHAWCEVFTGSRWETFDPTAPGGDGGPVKLSKLAEVAQFLDYMEFKWATSVVAYDQTQRQNLMENLNTAIDRTAVRSSQSFSDWPRRIGAWWDRVKRSVLGGAIAVMIVCVFGAVAGYVVDRLRMRRRAKRIGLESLPTPEQLRLVRQLGFYDDLLRILDRHQIHRPEHLTPLEFSRTLSFLPNTVYDEVYRLTKLFYRIRFGGQELDTPRQRHLTTVVHRIQRAMEEVPSPIWPQARHESNYSLDR
jgi:protein-glutamine gamma-glutamyltransferase